MMKNKEELLRLTNKIYRFTILFPKKEPLRYRLREVADDFLEGFTKWNVFSNSNPINFNSLKGLKEEIIFDLEKSYDVLKNYFEIVKWQNWVSYFDILKLEEKYDLLWQKIKGEIEEKIKQAEEKSEILEERNCDVLSGDKDDDIKDRSGSLKLSESNRNLILINKKSEFSQINQVIVNKRLNERQSKILEALKTKETLQVWEVKKMFPDISKRTLRRDFEKLLKMGYVQREGERSNTFYKLKK